MKWPPDGKQILTTNSLRKCIEDSPENLYLDIVRGLKVKVMHKHLIYRRGKVVAGFKQ